MELNDGDREEAVNNYMHDFSYPPKSVSFKRPPTEFPLKITPEKLVIPSSGHLDVKILNPRTEEGFSVNVTLASLRLEITRVWYMKNGKEEELKKSQHNEFYHDFDDDKKTERIVYFRIGLATTLNLFLNPRLPLETPEGSVQIECFRRFPGTTRASDEEPMGCPTIKLKTLRSFELLMESKDPEAKGKFLEFQKNQKRRNLLREIVLEGEEKKRKKIIWYEGYTHEDVEIELEIMREKRDKLNEKVLLGHSQKIDGLSDEELKKLFEEENKEEIEAERRLMELRAENIKKQEEQRRLEEEKMKKVLEKKKKDEMEMKEAEERKQKEKILEEKKVEVEKEEKNEEAEKEEKKEEKKVEVKSVQIKPAVTKNKNKDKKKKKKKKCIVM